MSRDWYAVIGDPVAHSLSPVMHNAAFAAAGIGAQYRAERVPPADLATRFPALIRTYAGLNVTVPHKEAVVSLVDEVDDIVRRLGAANTIRIRLGRVYATNTDPAGFRCALASAIVPGEGMQALVFGAGGAARSVVNVLGSAGVTVYVDARNPDRARDLTPLGAVPSHSIGLHAALAGADIVVNCTPLGMGALSGCSPLPPDAELKPGAVVMDLVYGHETPFLREAARQGACVMDGLEMLIFQGAESFRFWTGVEPDISVMRAACRQALKEKACSAS